MKDEEIYKETNGNKVQYIYIKVTEINTGEKINYFDFLGKRKKIKIYINKNVNLNNCNYYESSVKNYTW